MLETVAAKMERVGEISKFAPRKPRGHATIDCYMVIGRDRIEESCWGDQ